LFAQLNAKASIIQTLHQSYPIPGSHLLQKQEQALRDIARQHPELLTHPSVLHKTNSWSFAVGNTKTWYATDFTNNVDTEYTVSSTCRAIGTNCYIFVENSNWTNGRITQASVDSIQQAFDLRTPANPSKGIFQMDVDAFGNPPDVDNDPKIVILILDIRDGYSPSGDGGYIAGYFYQINELPESVAQAYGSNHHSNNAEIYYVDCNPAVLTSSRGFIGAASTTAHEFQHMIHYNYTHFINNNINHQTFINEGCSVLAEVHCGYPMYEQSYYDGETNHTLFDWRADDMTNVLKDYSRAARFFTYIRDQIGIGVFKDFVNSTQDGVLLFDDAFSRFGTAQRFSSLLPNWFIANILNDTTVNASYGYRYPGVPTVQSTPMYSISGLNTIEQYAAKYISYTNDSATTLKFTSSSTNLFVKAIEIGTSNKRVVDVPLNSEFYEPLLGSTYTQLHFIVYNTSGSNTAIYSLDGTVDSTIVLRYDFTEPLGSISGTAGDTMCVWFNAVSGGKLDSIRVALRSAGTMNGGIYLYNTTWSPSPLGKKLATISATVTQTPSYPYPVPYNNWAGIDVRSYNISTSSAFAVAFINGQSGIPHIMVTSVPAPEFPTSIVYDNDATQKKWEAWASNTAKDSVWIWLIRAYVTLSSGSDTIIDVTPATYSLSQNYPNPYSSSTKIDFYLPSDSWVTLKIYDILGREVMTCINGMMSQGSYNQYPIKTTRLASGVYFYRLQAGSFTQTKKMVLIK
jgi:hypothetical protein